jgi:hypothetical protein
VIALANSLVRIWSAKNRLPHLTGWGTTGSTPAATQEIAALRWALEKLVDLTELAQRTAPAVIALTLNIFR